MKAKIRKFIFECTGPLQVAAGFLLFVIFVLCYLVLAAKIMLREFFEDLVEDNIKF